MHNYTTVLYKYAGMTVRDSRIWVRSLFCLKNEQNFIRFVTGWCSALGWGKLSLGMRSVEKWNFSVSLHCKWWNAYRFILSLAVVKAVCLLNSYSSSFWTVIHDVLEQLFLGVMNSCLWNLTWVRRIISGYIWRMCIILVGELVQKATFEDISVVQQEDLD